MTFDWRDYLAIANSLSNAPDAPGPPEASHRTSASRAYYSVFNTALAYAEGEGFSPRRSGDDHIGLQRFFRSGDATRDERRIAQELGRLFNLRRQADYERALDRSPDALSAHAIGHADLVTSLLTGLEP